MCPLTHIYISTKVAGRQTPLLVFGSVLPDVVWISKIIPPDKIHDKPNNFYGFVKSKNNEMLDLSLGVKLHSNDKGADYYSHFYNGGYAMNKGKMIVKEIANLFKSEDQKLNLIKAHNFIEAALDLHLLKENPSLPGFYRKSLDKLDVLGVARLIGDYIGVNENLVKKELELFISLAGPDSVSSEDAFAVNFFPRLINVAFGKKVSKEEILPILKKAQDITKDSYKELLEDSISRMQKDFGPFI